MERLAEYILEFARLLGEQKSVHLGGIASGSILLRARIDEVAAPEVEWRLTEASRGQGDPTALKAIQALDDMMAEDNATGLLQGPAGGVIIEFPGRNRNKQLEYGPFREDGVIEGIVIKVGGMQQITPVWLQDGRRTYKKCSANRNTARELALHLFGRPLRASGTGS
jgi:hypothetical protein